MSSFSVGDRVRHSGYVIQRKRDTWNSWGREPYKSHAKDDLDNAIAERGTVTAILAGDPVKGSSPGLEIKWDNGSISHTLDYMVSPA